MVWEAILYSPALFFTYFFSPFIINFSCTVDWALEMAVPLLDCMPAMAVPISDLYARGNRCPPFLDLDIGGGGGNASSVRSNALFVLAQSGTLIVHHHILSIHPLRWC